MSDVPAFLERFRRFGAGPSVETYLDLFHDDATLFDSGMQRPIGVAEIPEHIAAILRVVAGFRMTPERWRHAGGTLFVEARNRAELGGRELRWRSVYCMDLRGDRVVRGRRYYDRRPLFARLDPAIPRLSLPAFADAAEPVAEPASESAEPVSQAAELAEALGKGLAEEGFATLAGRLREDGCLWCPTHPRPLQRSEVRGHARAFAEALPGLEVFSLCFAGDDALLFLEWEARAELAGQALRFGGCDRLDLAAGQVLQARRYFDTLHLAAVRAAAVQAGGPS